MDLEQKAKEFATQKHGGQLRKDGVTPYINHCASVVALLKEVGVEDEETFCAGWLHDVMEDCGVTREQIEREFGNNIAGMVYVLTRNVGREEYKERMRNSDLGTQMVKLADTVHNCSEMGQPDIPKKTIRTKVEDCETLYLRLAEEICPLFHTLLENNIAPYRVSHFISKHD